MLVLDPVTKPIKRPIKKPIKRPIKKQIEKPGGYDASHELHHNVMLLSQVEDFDMHVRGL